MTDLKINTYPKHIGDWRSGTARMSLAEEGAYTRLCDQYYLDQGEGWTIDECLRICRAVTRDEQKAVKAVIASKFDKTNAGYSHAGMNERIVDIEKASATNRARAEAAARARWAKQNGDKPFPNDAPSNAPSTKQALLEECHPKAKSQKPVIEDADDSADVPDIVIPISQTDDWPLPAETAQALAKTAGLQSAQWQLLTASELLAWRNNGFSYLLDIVPTVTAVTGRAKRPPGSWSYFTSAIAQNHANRTKQIEIPEPENERRSPNRYEPSAGRSTDYMLEAIADDIERRNAFAGGSGE